MIWLFGGRLAAALVVLVLALAVAISVAMLWSRARRWIPLPLILGGYAIAPGLLSLINGEGLDAALLGAAFPLHHPFFLRGAYLAVEVLLPLVALAAIVLAVIRWRSHRRQAQLLAGLAVLAALAVQLGAYNAGALGLPTILAFEHPADRRAPCSHPGLEAAAPGSGGVGSLGGGIGGLLGGSPPATDSVSTATQLPCRPETGVDNSAPPTQVAETPVNSSTATKAGEAATQLTQAKDALPKYDLESLMAAHQGTPTELFTYVRDKIGLDAYSGAMRGALGTETTRSGNPTDKALLLAELLKRGGATVRFARASLDASDVAKLVDASRNVRAELTASVSAAGVDRAVAAAPEQQRDRLRSGLTKGASNLQMLRAEADGLAKDMADTLSAAHIALGNDSQLRADAMLALRDHVWIQVQTGDDWQDMDPSLPALQAGQRLATAKSVTTSEALPDDAYVTLEVRAVATRLINGSPVDADVVSASRRVIETLGERLSLEVVPESDVPMKELVQANSFRAHLHIGGDDMDGEAFQVDDQEKGPMAALSMVVTVRRPGMRPDIYSRNMLERRDRSGAIGKDWSDAGRVACVLTSRFDGLVTSGAFAPAFVRAHGLDELIAVQNARAAGHRPNGSEGLAGDFPYTALRFLYRAQVIRPTGVQFVVDRPNIVFERGSLDCPAGQLRTRAALDIMENGRSALASSAALAARANLTRGALDQLIEGRLRGPRTPRLDAPTIIAAAGTAKIYMVTLLPSDTAALKALALPPAFERAVASTLAAGQVARLTRSPVNIDDSSHVAWWAVDAPSGNAIGRMDDGGGQESTEYLVPTTNTVITVFNVAHFDMQIKYCGMRVESMNLELANAQFDACISQAICKIALQEAEDLTFGILGASLEGEEKAIDELVQLTFSAAEPGVASPAVADCGEDPE